MTPQLQQAIKLLQLSRIELLETVQQELLENPFLEEAHADEGSAPMEETRPSSADDADGYTAEAARNADWEDYLGEFASTPRQATAREVELPEEMTSYEARFSVKPSLESHLTWQLRLSRLTEEQMDIGEIIIGLRGATAG